MNSCEQHAEQVATKKHYSSAKVYAANRWVTRYLILHALKLEPSDVQPGAIMRIIFDDLLSKMSVRQTDLAKLLALCTINLRNVSGIFPPGPAGVLISALISEFDPASERCLFLIARSWEILRKKAFDSIFDGLRESAANRTPIATKKSPNRLAQDCDFSRLKKVCCPACGGEAYEESPTFVKAEHLHWKEIVITCTSGCRERFDPPSDSRLSTNKKKPGRKRSRPKRFRIRHELAA